MIHALITAALCAVLYFLPISNGYAIGFAGFYLGREIAQAEYRYIETYCNRHRAAMPWYAPLLPKAWTVKGMCDFILPAVVVAAFMFYC